MYKSRDELKNSEIFKKYCSKRNYAESSKNSLISLLFKYCQINQMTLQELYDEADKEEEMKIREKNRKIVDRLENYRQVLINENYSSSYITESFVKIKTFFRTFRLEIPYIPPLQLPQRQLMYDDIPKKEHIKKVIDSTGHLMHKAVILFMFSSFSATVETLNLTCQMFVDATKEYHNKDDIGDVINELDGKKDIIPLFLFSRQKRANVFEEGYKYYTCCSPEATQAIITYLKYRNGRRPLKNNDRIFNVTAGGLKSSFKRLNDKQGWGKIGNSRFFRAHALRIAACTAVEDEYIGDLFSGRKRSKIHEIYAKKNPKKLKEIYIENLSNLTINKTKTYSIKTDEYKALEKELKSKDVKQKELEERLAIQEEQNREIMEMLKKRP